MCKDQGGGNIPIETGLFAELGCLLIFFFPQKLVGEVDVNTAKSIPISSLACWDLVLKFILNNAICEVSTAIPRILQSLVHLPLQTVLLNRT